MAAASSLPAGVLVAASFWINYACEMIPRNRRKALYKILTAALFALCCRILGRNGKRTREGRNFPNEGISRNLDMIFFGVCVFALVFFLAHLILEDVAALYVLMRRVEPHTCYVATLPSAE